MKPKPFFFRDTSIFGASLRYGAPVFTGLMIVVSGLEARAGDILRGGGGGSAKPRAGTHGGTPTPAATDAARANARDSLARTTRALEAVRAMQKAARNAAIRGADNAGRNPNKPGLTLPNIPNGLGTGGLKVSPLVATDTSKWKGARLPTQKAGKDGRVKVTIQQTEQQALLNWETFNVGKKTTLAFDQSAGGSEAGQWIAFNKVSDPSANPSQILGKIKADGQVYIINQNGIIFGGSSQVNARGLTVSSLPINDKLVNSGLLNNPDTEFLFSGLGLTGKAGDVTVQAGARIKSSVSNDGNGGRVFLAGANVTNEGTISTPNGQTVLAAGLQVGLLAHAGNDPSVRGLDVYVGAVVDPASVLEPYAGTATNLGLIEGALGNITITGKDVNQSGIVESSTSVSLNGSVRLLANYGAVRNDRYQSNRPSTGSPFNYTSSGSVSFGKGSVTRILPEYARKEKVTGTRLALRSRIEAQGKSIHLGKEAEIFAPNAIASLNAGVWTQLGIEPYAGFLRSDGQVYLDEGSRINLAGTVDATASVLQNYLTVTLRGPELSVAPLQRDGKLRGDTIVVDITKTGTYNGKDWVGTPLADVSGYLNLIERDIAQLTTEGGTLDLSAGGSVVIREGAKIDVSGGWTNFTGDTVQTTRLWNKGRLVDIADATPDQVYSGIFTGTSTITNTKWGVSRTFDQALAPTGRRFEDGFTQGAGAGSVSIAAPAVALDGTLLGKSLPGPKQIHTASGGSRLPATGSLSLKLEAQLYDATANTIQTYFPTSPDVIFGTEKQKDVKDFDPASTTLEQGRVDQLYLSPALVSRQGFGNLTVVNEGGDIIVPENITLAPRDGSTLSLTAANIDVLGSIVSPGSSVSFKALNLTSYQGALLGADPNSVTPPPNEGRGLFTLGKNGVIHVAGRVTDQSRQAATDDGNPVTLNGGNVNIAAFSARLGQGGKIDVSSGFLLDSANKGSFGTGGSIAIEAGRDKSNPTPLGGTLHLRSTLLGYGGGGKSGGTLSLQAAHIQIGGSGNSPDTLYLDPGFFSEGGFNTFRLTGLGVGANPGVLVADGTRITPVVRSHDAVIRPPGSGKLSLEVIKDIESSRLPVNLVLASPGVRSLTTVEVGDVIIGKDSLIRTDAGGSVSLSGGTVSVLGSIITPGGSITAGGGSTSVLNESSTEALVTTFIGPDAILSAAGAVVRVPDAYGLRTGRVLNGGRITLTGNIAASTGSVLDVSGTRAEFDIDPNLATPTGSPEPRFNGLTSPPAAYDSVPMKIESSGGNIVLQGNEMLHVGSTLLGKAGGRTALGGSLAVSSKTYSPLIIPPVFAVNLTVTQEGSAVSSGIGAALEGGGHFSVGRLENSGLDALSLNGVVSFEGKVRLAMSRSLQVASTGFLYADASVNLSAPHVVLGQSQKLVLPQDEISPFAGTSVLPTHGTGKFAVDAKLVDLGHLSFRGIGEAFLKADGGDIRGSGTMQIAGDLTLKAGQIYPNTASKLHLIAYDPPAAVNTTGGSIRVVSAGARSLPLSAGGTLSLHASRISQEGTLRAPFGTIQLGWDGTGARPIDLLAGASAGSLFPVTTSLLLGSGSETSVSAVDPATGKGIRIPYGISTDGENWIDPRGMDITSSGAPQKNILLSAGSVTSRKGSTIDLRGGGDVYAYRWISGLGGPSDILDNSLFPNSFAVLPSYSAHFAPVADYNTDPKAENQIAGYQGYTNTALKPGDRIYLSGSGTLAAGYYTLLPSRYALLPGGVLVTPTGGSNAGPLEMPDSSSVVSGFRFNSLGDSVPATAVSTRFELASGKVVRDRAEYQEFVGTPFFRNIAGSGGASATRLTADSGTLVFQATQAMELLGDVASAAISKNGRGAAIDISTPLHTIITYGKAAPSPGTIQLDAATLSSFGAESLLIGGRRSLVDGSISVSVTSDQLTVDTRGTALRASDLTLVAKNKLTIADGSILHSDSVSAVSDDLHLTGDGSLLRVSADKSPVILRSSVTTAGTAELRIGKNALIQGSGIILDSSGAVSLDPAAVLTADSYQINAGSMAIQLKNPGLVPAGSGLVLTDGILDQIQSASSLKLLSYSTIDLYGNGTFGSLSGLVELTLSAGAIRAMNTGGGHARIAADTLRIENSAFVSSIPGTGSTDGKLSFLAGSLELGAGPLSITGYSSVKLDASRGILSSATGTLSIEKNLRAATPVFAGAAGVKHDIQAGGNVVLANANREATDVLSSGLGSSLSITGTSVKVDTRISMPSGTIDLHAKSGDLGISGRLDVSGRGRTFHDATRFTSAGGIKLTADAGDIRTSADSVLDLTAPAGGGNGGLLSVSVPAGSYSQLGQIRAAGGNNGSDGRFTLDVLSLPSLAGLAARLTASDLTETQSIRVRTGNIVVDGTNTARNFRLTADQGDIAVTGTINASGATGGAVHLAAHGNLNLETGSLITVAGRDFNSAGKGGSIVLEAGTQSGGLAGTGQVNILGGSVLDLSVASKIAGPAATEGSSAYLGKFSGKLHIRAPRVAANNELLVGSIDGSIIDASSILVEGYKLYDLTSTAGVITSAVQTSVRNDGNAFLGASGSTTANYTNITSRLLANNAALADLLVLAPGAEIIHRSGDLTLGSTSSNTTSDWNLSNFRFGAKGAPGVLTLRAAGNLVFFNALSDGFTPTLANTDPSWLWTSRLTTQSALLPINRQHWTYRMTAGADLNAAGFGDVLPASLLASDKGFLKLGKNATNVSTTNGTNATTSSALANRFQVIRTGSGDIAIHTARDLQFLNQFATIYTAGTRVADATMGGLFRIPLISNVSSAALGGAQQNYAVQYSMAGGNVDIVAGGNIERLTLSAGQLVADSQFQMPNNWLYRRGYVDGSGNFGTDRFGFATSTTWWVDFSNFFQGIGALGGGNVNLSAGGNISNVDAVIPTNARMPGYTDATQVQNAAPDVTRLLELGGGDLKVSAGNDLDAGVYYVERGQGSLTAGGNIITNATRSVLNRAQTQVSEYTRLPTTLFLGKGGFTVHANGNILLGPVANPFLLPTGQLNSYYYKTYFSTYAPSNQVVVGSLGGNITFREAASLGGTSAQPILQIWYENKLRLTNNSAASNKPWLRLAETSVDPFTTLFTLQPSTLDAVSFSGDVNLVGNLLLSPSSRGNLSLLARGSINALQPAGLSARSDGTLVDSWVTSRINLSDADPGAIPGITTPFGFQGLVDPSTIPDTTGSPQFLDPISLLFAESGATLGESVTLLAKQQRHAAGLLHRNDLQPLTLYAGQGDISGLVLFSPKVSRVIAGRDIADVSLYIQNTSSGDASVVASGGNLYAHSTSSLLRQQATTGNNQLATAGGVPLDGDIQINGPGTLQVLAGRNLDLGTGSNNPDGTGTGITSIGNTRNPYLPNGGADVVVAAGIGLARGLSDSRLNLAEFITTYVLTPKGAKYVKEISPGAKFGDLPEEEQARVAVEVFNRILRDAGREYLKTGSKKSYKPAQKAIEVLFGSDAAAWEGEILARSRDIRTANGGDITILTPGGGLALADTTTGSTLAPPGIITAAGGNISIFANNDVSIGIGRIFTLRGGNEIIWSSKGDIAAGSSSKTVQTASPTRVRIDPQTATVQTDLSGLATGGGIGVLDTVKGVEPGDVDLIAPEGTVDAGDAGIRVSGNLNIAATQVLNAANISVTGSSTGTPAPVSVAANVGGLTTASNTAAATNAATTAAQPRNQNTESTDAAPELPSIITVDVLGYGQEEDEDDEEEEQSPENGSD